MLDFVEKVPTIKMQDGLANVLSVSKDGVIEYTYFDVVKLAGHSCPTVAGAYLMLLHGLKALYGDKLAQRGNIKVTIQGKLGDGTVGVVGNVASLITGATDISGFHGLAGKFDRRNLLFYDTLLDGNMKLERLDTNQSVLIKYDPTCVLPDSKLSELMGKMLSGNANKEEMGDFGILWQDRVKKILLDYSDRVVSLS